MHAYLHTCVRAYVRACVRAGDRCALFGACSGSTCIRNGSCAQPHGGCEGVGVELFLHVDIATQYPVYLRGVLCQEGYWQRVAS